MAATSVGVRLSDDFKELPLFETPPVDGPTKKVGTLSKDRSVRAVKKTGDFLLLEADVEDGSDGLLGWVDASCVVPAMFPALYEFASDLPDAVSLMVRASPQAGAEEAGKVVGKGSIIMATGLEGDYISMSHQDVDDPSSPAVRGWMLTATDDRVLLTVRPAFLVVPAPGLPDGVQLRVRAAPEGTAAEVKQVSAAPGTIFEVAEQSGDWLRVLMGTAVSAWMSSLAQGMPLLKPASKTLFVMDPQLVAKHGDAVKLVIREAPSAEAAALGEMTHRGRVYCVGTRGPWLRVLYQGHKDAWMLSVMGAMQLLVPAASVGGSNAPPPSSSSNSRAPPEKAPPRAAAAAAAPKKDGNRYMTCGRQVTVRADPEFYAMDVGVAPGGAVVRVFEEKEEINEAKQTKDVWVRGQVANSSAGGDSASNSAALMEGWLLAFSTKRGAMMTDARDPLAAQVAFQKQENAAKSASKPAVAAGPSPEEAAAATAAAAAAAAAKAAPSLPSSAVGGYLRSAGMLKIREEADSLSMELGTVSAGELVKVEQTSGLWVRILYRGESNGWVLTANKRATMLTKAEGSPASAAKEFQSQEAAAAAASAKAAAAAAAPKDDEEADQQPLTGAKGRGVTTADAGTKAPEAVPPAAPAVTAVSSKKANAAAPGQFMTSAGPLKIREEADPYSLDFGVLNKGDIVKVLETSALWVRVAYRGRTDGWVLTANKRGTILLPVDGDVSAASEGFETQEAGYAAAAVAAAVDAVPPDDDADRPLTGAKTVAADTTGEDRPLNAGGSEQGAWKPPSEYPPGHEEPKAGVGFDGKTADKSGGGMQDGGFGRQAPQEASASAASGSEYMTSLGPLKIRDEADPYSLELGMAAKGDIVKVLETSKLWVRVSYHGREDGWVLTANKRGPILVPCEHPESAAGKFDAQEAAFAETTAGSAAVPPVLDDADRPLTGAKPPPVLDAGADDERPLTVGSGKGSWVPPSEFPPGHVEEALPSSQNPGGASSKGDAIAGGVTAGGGVSASSSSVEYMMALGMSKLREEADPYSLELGSLAKGDVVKIVETSKLWVRVCYHGREDGWVLTANKRGPTLLPCEHQESAAEKFDAQEAAFAETAAAATAAPPVIDETDRPLTGAKPPPVLDAGADDERPLTAGSGKGSWVPPSEFPPGHVEEALPSGAAVGAAAGLDDERPVQKKMEEGGKDSGGIDAEAGPEYMTALGMSKLREEADPYSLELGGLAKGDVVKVVETSKLWVRVRYRGREDGWVLTANKRGPTLTPCEHQESAAEKFDAQEAAFAETAAAATAAPPVIDEADRPLTGAKPPPVLDAGADDERPLTAGSGKGSWVPPSEFPPGHVEEALPSAAAVGAATGLDDERPVQKKMKEGGKDSGGIDVVVGAEYMSALGMAKLREEADPYSRDFGTLDKGSIVKVLETSKLWARVCYHERQDGWVLTANKRGPLLLACEDQDSAAGKFDAQESAFAVHAAEAAASAPSNDDRPLTGAKHPMAPDPADRPLTAAGEKGAWVPPSEFPPGHEEEAKQQEDVSPTTSRATAAAAASGDVDGDGAGVGSGLKAGVETEAGGEMGADGEDEERGFMTALGPLKLRDEADPYSLELGMVSKGDIVKILETSDLWIRVSYSGREDGWVLTANKRGPILDPVTDPKTAAEEFDAQEAAFAEAASAAAAAPSVIDEADRPLTGAKPPPVLDAGADDERPLTAGGAKGSWVPPSEFPLGRDEGQSGSPAGEGMGVERPLGGTGGGDGGAVRKANDEQEVDADGAPRFMTCAGLIKIRDEADPHSMDIGTVAQGDVVKVLEMDGLWARVGYHGNTNGWVLTANRRGAIFTAVDDDAAAEALWSEQERKASEALSHATAGDDRPLGGSAKRNAQVEDDEGGNGSVREVVDDTNRQAAVDTVSESEGSSASSAGGDQTSDAAQSKPWQRQRKAPPTSKRRSNENSDGATGKPWHRKKTGIPEEGETGGVSGEAEGVLGGGVDEPLVSDTAPMKPWLRKKRPVRKETAGVVADGVMSEGDPHAAAMISKSQEGDDAGQPDAVEGASKGLIGGDVEDAEGDVANLEACLEERDWKKRLKGFESASRACRTGDGDAAAMVGPLLPQMLQDKNVQVVDAAVNTLTAFLASRSTMDSEETAALMSALAERALCCGRGPIEANADSAATMLLDGRLGQSAQRGAWLTLTARSGGAENEFFPPPAGADSAGARSKAAVAAAAPKAVGGCVRAMSSAMKGAGSGVAGSMAGGGECRREVYATAKSLLRSSKLPIKMAGVSLATSLYAAEGASARGDLGMDDDMDNRMKAQVERAFADVDAAAKDVPVPASAPPDEPTPPLLPASPARHAGARSSIDGGGGDPRDDASDGDDSQLLTPPAAAASSPGRRGLDWDTGEGSESMIHEGIPSADANDNVEQHLSDAESGRDGGEDVDESPRSERDVGGDDGFVRTVAESRDGRARDVGSIRGSEEGKAGVGVDKQPEAVVGDLRGATSSSPNGGRPTSLHAREPYQSRRLSSSLSLRLAAAREGSSLTAGEGKSETPRSSFRWSQASQSSGFRGRAVLGVRSASERETQFLGGQMLVLPDGERSAWDDILAEILQKAPSFQFQPPRRVKYDAPKSPVSRRPLPSALYGKQTDLNEMLPPPMRSAVSPRGSSRRSIDVPSKDNVARGRTTPFELHLDENLVDEEVESEGDWTANSERPDDAASIRSDQGDEWLEESQPSLPTDGGPGRRGEGYGSERAWETDRGDLVTRSADESLREQLARMNARRPRHGLDAETDAAESSAPVVAAAGRRHLLRSPGSWAGGGGAGGRRQSAAGFRGGAIGGSSGALGSLGSPSSSSNMIATQEVIGNLTNHMASLKWNAQSTAENRENRRQSISRRIQRGASVGAGRAGALAAGGDGRDPDGGLATAASAESEAAEAVALGASPAAAMAAAEAATGNEISAHRRRKTIAERLSARRSLARERASVAGPAPSGRVLGDGVEDAVLFPTANATRLSGRGTVGGRLGRLDANGGAASEEEEEEGDVLRRSRGVERTGGREESGAGPAARDVNDYRDDVKDDDDDDDDDEGTDGFAGGLSSSGVSGQEGPRLSTIAPPSDTTPAETPVDSPRSGSDSDAAYDTLRGVLGKVHLKKYFGEFRQREVRLEELKVLTESDLTEMGLPMGARKRLLVEVHGSVSPPHEAFHPALSPGFAPLASFGQQQQQQHQGMQMPAHLGSPRLMSLMGDVPLRTRESFPLQPEETDARHVGPPGTGAAPTARVLFSPRTRTNSASMLTGTGAAADSVNDTGATSGNISLSSRSASWSTSPRAGLRQQQRLSPPQPPTISLSPPSSTIRGNPAMESAESGERLSGNGISDESFESGLGDDGEFSKDTGGGGSRNSSSSGTIMRRHETADALDNSPGRASVGEAITRVRGPSLLAPGRGPEHRSTIGGSGYEARRAKAAAAMAAVNTATAAVERATAGSRLPRRSSALPREASGATASAVSRMPAPASRLARPSSAGRGRGVTSTGRVVAPVAVDEGEEGASGSADAGAPSRAKDGEAGVSVSRRSFIPRPSPKSGRSFIPRSSGRA